MPLHSVIATVSYGSTENKKYITSIHIVSFDDTELSEEEAKKLQDYIVKMICSITKKQKTEEKKPIMGVYKVEHHALSDE